VNFNFAFCAEGILEPFLDERNGEVRDVYADPLAVEFLRGVKAGPQPQNRFNTVDKMNQHYQSLIFELFSRNQFSIFSKFPG
jgi:hypothetical protein